MAIRIWGHLMKSVIHWPASPTGGASSRPHRWSSVVAGASRRGGGWRAQLRREIKAHTKATVHRRNGLVRTFRKIGRIRSLYMIWSSRTLKSMKACNIGANTALRAKWESRHSSIRTNSANLWHAMRTAEEQCSPKEGPNRPTCTAKRRNRCRESTNKSTRRAFILGSIWKTSVKNTRRAYNKVETALLEDLAANSAADLKTALANTAVLKGTHLRRISTWLVFHISPSIRFKKWGSRPKKRKLKSTIKALRRPTNKKKQ